MSTSSRAGERGRRGFTLVEALVALVVAGLLLPALARAMGGAWSASRAPMEIVTGVALAGDLAAGVAVRPEARASGFQADRAVVPASILVLPSDVAPAPRGADDASALRPESTPASIRLAVPKGFEAPAPGAAARAMALQHVSVTVHTPSGRRVVIDRIAVDDAAR